MWVQEPEGLGPGKTTFHVWGVVYPLWVFGLPDGDSTVIPAGQTASLTTPNEGGGFRYGTLSKYRAEKCAIDVKVDLGARIQGNLSDNNLIVRVADNCASSAFARTHNAIELYFDHASVSIGARLFFDPAGMKVEGGVKVPLLRSAGGQTIRWYDLNETRVHLQDAQRFAQEDDERLQRALDYYSHALLLIEVSSTIDDTSRHADFIQAEVFLNLWKAVTAIVGDPSRPADRYQSRYTKLGFDRDYFESSIEYMKEIRNASDVAHHHISREAIEKVGAERGRALGIARQVIDSYRAFLVRGERFA